MPSMCWNFLCSICDDAHTCDEPKPANKTCQNLFVLRRQEKRKHQHAVCSNMLLNIFLMNLDCAVGRWCRCERTFLSDPSPVSPHHSNCPCSLAAALARATADSLLQTDLSIHHLNKAVEDGADPLPRESPGSPRDRSPAQIRSLSHFIPHTHTQACNHQGFVPVLPPQSCTERCLTTRGHKVDSDVHWAVSQEMLNPMWTSIFTLKWFSGYI